MAKSHSFSPTYSPTDPDRDYSLDPEFTSTLPTHQGAWISDDVLKHGWDYCRICKTWRSNLSHHNKQVHETGGTVYTCNLPVAGNPGHVCDKVFHEPYHLQNHRHTHHDVWYPTDAAYAERQSSDPNDIAKMTKGLLREVLAKEHARFNGKMWYTFGPVYRVAFDLGFGQTFPLDFPTSDIRPRDTSIPDDKKYTAAQLVAMVAIARSGCEQ